MCTFQGISPLAAVPSKQAVADWGTDPLGYWGLRLAWEAACYEKRPEA